MFRCSKAAAPALKAAHGAIVSVASIAGVSAQGSSTPYARQQGGGGEPDALPGPRAGAGSAGERGGAGVGGQCLADRMERASTGAQAAEKAVLKRRCTPEDIAEVIVFLGFGAAMVTGQTVVVDGGLTL